MNIKDIINNQKRYYLSHQTLPYKFRKEALLKLRKAILRLQPEIELALKVDLGKSSTEAYMTEIGNVLFEIKKSLRKLKHWMKPKKVASGLANPLANSYIMKAPYGNVLIISPWNYPFLLCMSPLIGSIIGGNTTIIKPSEYAPNVANIIKQLISEIYPEEYVSVILGDSQVSSELLNHKFDFIFFTGSNKVGQIVLQKASINMTPVCLELGGKSPCIVLKDANLHLASKRIMFGKLLNSGQTCVAPDYVYVDSKIKDQLIKELIKATKELYGENPLIHDDYGKIVNKKHYNRLLELIKNQKIILGGYGDGERIAPTILEIDSFDNIIMQEEIFGPILPIITFNDISEIEENLINKPVPLALYLFTNNKKMQKYILDSLQFGGGCVNDTMMHLINQNLPFGGFKDSGMGRYHGKTTFDTFTVSKSILKQTTLFDIKLRYAPYTDTKDSVIKKILK